ncbi:hypothetical protein ACQ4LE_004616 [Meloidogyne hapla]
MNLTTSLFHNNSNLPSSLGESQFLADINSLEDEQEWEDENDRPDEAEMQTRRTVKLVFCIGYAILFLLGTLGNGLVIVMIGNVLSTLNRNRQKSGAGPSRKMLAQASAVHVFIYVLGLSIVDLFVIMHLPMLIFEMLEGQWIFGGGMCKLYWFGESVNKLLSSFLMTVLSWDRFMAVCYPIRSIGMRTNTVAISVLASCTFIATLLLYPVLKESQVYQVNRLTGLRLVDEEIIAASQNNNLNFPTPQPHQIVLKCVFDTNSPFFMLYTFTVGYIIPAMLITFFYAQVIIKLRNDALAIRKHSEGHMHAPSPSVSSARLHKVTKRIVAVILFYFFCWTPYWLLNIMSQFGLIVVSWSTLTLSSVFFAAHFLVCFNSAANPVLYALINRELRQQHAQAFQKRRRSLHLITTNNTTAMTDKDLNSPTIARLKEHRLSSLGCTDHSRLMLLGNGLLNGQHLENGQQLEKRSSSFSHSTPPMFAGLTSRFSQLRLLSHFGSSQLLNINGEDKLEDLPNFKIEEKKILKNENDVAKQKKSVPSSGGDSDAFL